MNSSGSLLILGSSGLLVIIIGGIVLIITELYFNVMPSAIVFTPTIQAIFISFALIVPLAFVENRLRSKSLS